jgi:hypothetical protein
MAKSVVKHATSSWSITVFPAILCLTCWIFPGVIQPQSITEVAVIGPPFMGIDTAVVAMRRSLHDVSRTPYTLKRIKKPEINFNCDITPVTSRSAFETPISREVQVKT